jgi:DNA-binding Lrp family transcriptional regulator
MTWGLELSSFLRGDERRRAVLLLESLRVEGVGNQKEVANRLGLSEANLSRLAAKLEGRGYLSRVRGERKELILQLTSVEYLGQNGGILTHISTKDSGWKFPRF